MDWEYSQPVFELIFSLAKLLADNSNTTGKKILKFRGKCKTQNYLTRNFLDIGAVATFYAQLASHSSGGEMERFLIQILENICSQTLVFNIFTSWPLAQRIHLYLILGYLHNISERFMFRSYDTNTV